MQGTPEGAEQAVCRVRFFCVGRLVTTDREIKEREKDQQKKNPRRSRRAASKTPPERAFVNPQSLTKTGVPSSATHHFPRVSPFPLIILRWVGDQLGTRPVKSWAAGCQDYLKHIEQIRVDFKDVLEAQKGASDGPATFGGAKPVAPPVSTFGGSSAAQGGGASVGTPAQENSLFASSAAPSRDKPGLPAAAPASLFPNAASNPFMSSAPSSLFGGALTPAATSSPAVGGFGFGFGAAAPGGLFGGVNANTPSFLPPSTPAGADGDDEDEEAARPPSPSYQEKARNDDDHEEALLKVKCKFFTKKDATEPWADHGVNHLEFLREKEATEGIKRSRVVCRNSIGKAVMNAGLYANMSVQIVDKKAPDGSVKKNGVIVNLFNAVEENAKTITLIRLGKEEDVLNLQKLFEENVAAMSA